MGSFLGKDNEEYEVNVS